MSVRLDRPPIPLSNRFACLEEEESFVYTIEELLAIRETVPKEDRVMKAAIEAIIGKVDQPAPRRAEGKARYGKQDARHSNYHERAERAARQRLFAQSKDSAYRHFQTKRVWVPKNPSKK